MTKISKHRIWFLLVALALVSPWIGEQLVAFARLVFSGDI